MSIEASTLLESI